jgi:DNA ligase-1
MIKPQLSHSLEINKSPNDEFFIKNKLQGTWYLSEKYDGIRAIWTGEKLITRAGREFTFVPDWFIKSLPSNFPLDGEILIPNKEFSYFSSLTIQKECEVAHQKWNNVRYLIFDTPQSDKTFEQRLKELLKVKLPIYANVILFDKIENIQNEFDKINKRFDKIISRDGEGIMLIKADSLYAFGKRSRQSLKYKKFSEGEATVIDILEGTGKYKGVMGKIKCKLPNGKEFCCGTGFDDNQRNSYIFKDSQLVEIKDNPNIPQIGDLITYSCMEIIKKTNIPRMAVFKGVRTDLT